MAFVTGSKRYCQISSLAKVKVSRSNRKGLAHWSGGGPICTSLGILRVRGAGFRRAAQREFGVHHQGVLDVGGSLGLDQRPQTARNSRFEPDRLPGPGRTENLDS